MPCGDSLNVLRIKREFGMVLHMICILANMFLKIQCIERQSERKLKIRIVLMCERIR